MVVVLTDVQKHHAGAGGPVRAVDGISLSVADKSFVAVMGPSGSGKSTLLALLGALDLPDSGTIEVDGARLEALGGAAATRYRLAHVGFVFQEHNLIPDLSALDNVALPMEYAGIGRAERRKKAAQLLDLVDLDADKQARRPGKLSGGERQRVAIARAMANSPRLILADEPTGNLDRANAQNIADLLRLVVERFGVTVILVTHDRDMAVRADRVYAMADGKITEANGQARPTRPAVTRAPAGLPG